MDIAFRRRIRHIAFSCACLPGMHHLLRVIYRGVARGVAMLLQHEPAVVSLYLRRGCAKGEDIPGISDIDLGAVIHAEDVNAEQLQRRYHHIQRYLPILDPILETYTEASLATSERYCAVLRFHCEEGRQSFVRLYGPPRIEEMPPLNPALWPDALRNASTLYWSMFAEQLLSGDPRRCDPLLQTAQCVKSVAESLRSRCALETGILPMARHRALFRAENHEDKTIAEFARLLRILQERRFANPPCDLPDQTLTFLLRHADWMHKTLALRDRSTDLRRLKQAIDDNPAERHLPRSDMPGVTYRLSALWPVGEYLYVLPRSPYPPTMDFLRSQVAEARRILGAEVPLFFQHGGLLFQIGTARVPCRGRAILHPLINPETFSEEHPLSEARWTARSEAELVQWRAQLYWRAEIGLAEGRYPPADLPQWDMHFVKAVQLETIRRSALRGGVVYPLTRPAVARAAEREGIVIPHELLPLFSPEEAEAASALKAIGMTYRVAPELLRM